MGTTSVLGRSSGLAWLRGVGKLDRREREREGREKGNHDDIHDMSRLGVAFSRETADCSR